MLSQFQASYQRLEQSLDRLTESIAAYNPSISAADELAAADQIVDDDLDTLIIHQRNHARIQDLKQTSEALDQTLRTTIQVLADTRKDLAAISANSPPDRERREVGVEELLEYARFISKTTVPPTFRTKKVLDAPEVKAENGEGGAMNGAGTGSAHTQGVGTQQTGATADVDMKDSASALKLPLVDSNFLPWPSQEIIQQGALAHIQRMAEAGQDPASVLTAEEQAVADRERKDVEERERLKQEEAERRRISLFDGSVRRRGTVDDVFNPDDL